MIPISCFVCSFSKKRLSSMPRAGHLNPCVAHPQWLPRGQSRRRDSTDFVFQRGRGWGGDLPKQKKDPTLSAATLGVGQGGGRQLCVHEQFFGPGKRGKHSCVSSGSAISFEKGACRWAKKQSWSIKVIVSRPHVPATSAHQSNSETRSYGGKWSMCMIGRMVTFLQTPLQFPWDLASN